MQGFTGDVWERLKRGEIVTLGNKMYGLCGLCKKIVQLNKPIFGSAHVCVE